MWIVACNNKAAEHYALSQRGLKALYRKHTMALALIEIL
jgi:hypothetical protein